MSSTETNNPYPKRAAITPSTWFAFRLGSIVAILSFVIYAHSYIRDFMEEQRTAFREIRTELREIRAEQSTSWRIDSMERWAGRARWENRDKSISIPEPRDFWLR